jgi:uncharacterized DUF497 family protein
MVLPSRRRVRFFSIHFVTFIGTEVVRGEERETAIGMTGDWKLLKVVYVFSSEFIRLISARKINAELVLEAGQLENLAKEARAFESVAFSSA